MTPYLTAPVARSTDPLTSFLAGDSISQERRELSEEAVLWALEHGPLTDEQIEDKVRATARYQDAWVPGSPRLRTARSQLVKTGQVESSGLKRRTRSGSSATAWQLVSPSGERALFDIDMVA